MTRKPRQGRPARVVTPSVRVRVWPILSDAIEAEIHYGIRRIFKHDSRPRTEAELIEVADTIHTAVMNGIAELLDFGDD